MEKILRTTLRTAWHKGRTAILATGGLDSTALAVLAALRQPRLVFAAVRSPRCQAYNSTSIKACRQVSVTLGLPLSIVPIDAKDYFKSFLRLGSILPAPCHDTDLPAAAILFQHCRKLGIDTVISGMGSDELFSLNTRTLQTFIAATALPALDAHRAIARAFGIRFVCPFLHKHMLTWALATPLKERKNKAPLRALMARNETLAALLRGRPAAHSFIPDDFLKPVKTWQRHFHPRINDMPEFPVRCARDLPGMNAHLRQARP